MFQAFCTLGTVAFQGVFQTKNTSGVPTNADALPKVRVYGPTGFLLTATVAFKDSGAITAASNAAPIVVTSANHGLTTGTRVTITGVVGNTAANTTTTITKVDGNTFQLDGTTGNGAYVSGGTWSVTGLYSWSCDVTGANGFAAGQTYQALTTYAVSSTQLSNLDSFCVS